MQVNWLLEQERFDEDLGPLKAAIDESGSAWYESFVYDCNKINNIFPANSAIVAYGSLAFNKAVQKYGKYIPGSYMNLAALECTNYYNYLGGYLLNNNYVMLPYGELIRKKDWLIKCFPKYDVLVMRPSSGFKKFN